MQPGDCTVSHRYLGQAGTVTPLPGLPEGYLRAIGDLDNLVAKARNTRKKQEYKYLEQECKYLG